MKHTTPKLIVGLGNPGEKYDFTRHNLGFHVIDEFFKAQAQQLPDNQYKTFSLEAKLESEMATLQLGNDKYFLAKPKTFMNLSGRAIQKVVSFYNIRMGDILVIHDEKDIPLGKIRFSRSASAGGHNGVQSIIESLGSNEFCRLRIGISPSAPSLEQQKMAPADFVLQKFSPEELEEIKALTPKFIEAIESFFENGFEKTASQYN